jgi:hypothetical protein
MHAMANTQQQFLVFNKSTANNLRDYWLKAYGLHCNVEESGDHWKVICNALPGGHPWWRETCEAFVAGRRSITD